MGVRTRTQNRSIPCRLVAWTSPRFAWSVEVRAGNWTFASPPVVPPLVCAQQQGVRPPLHTQGVDIASAPHHALYNNIHIRRKCLPKCLPKCPKNAFGQNRTLSNLLFSVFWCFWCFFANPAFFQLSNLSKHKQNASIFARNKHKKISKACHVKQFLKL